MTPPVTLPRVPPRFVSEWHRRLFTQARVRILLWIAIGVAVAAMTMPFRYFTGKPFWENIEWLPFTDPTTHWHDILANIVLFLPFGFLLALHWKQRRGIIWKVTAAGAALSFCGEFYQIFCVHRHPSITDILSNTAGTLGGAWLAMLLEAGAGFLS